MKIFKLLKQIVFDEECRDEGMLVGLEDYIEKKKGKNILIVLHQMGNHGPAYYKRYQKSLKNLHLYVKQTS